MAMKSSKVVLKPVQCSDQSPVPMIDPCQAFDAIFHERTWGGCSEDFSGTGASLEQTRVVREELPKLCAEFEVRTLLDVPCGDFYWMKHTDLNGISYIGADIVRAIVDRNSRKFGDPRSGRQFLKLNLCEDPLPEVDLIFSRDCLVHLSFSDISKTLRNIYRSSASYLLTTTFTERDENTDIPTGEWRTLNLSLAPFCFPPPLRIIDEQCTLQGGAYRDKSLALWRIRDLAAVIELMQ
jgi:hypothetical protein